jgi:cytochrome P450
MSGSGCPAAALAENFDFSDERVRADPPAVYAELRKGPPRWSDAYGGFWVVSRYDDLKTVLANPLTFCSGLGTNLPPNGFPHRFPPNEADPPDHAKWRRLAAPFFSSKAVATLESSIRTVTREHLARFVEQGSADLAKDLAVHIPAYVIADMMGFPREDAPWFAGITDELLATAERPELAERNAQVGGELVGYLLEHLDARREHPQDDLLTELVQGEIDGRPLTPEELLGISFFFLIAGHETTVGGITFMLWRLGLNPDQRRRLIEDRSLITKAIEESLRIDSPVLHLARTVTEDTELGGTPMKARDKIMVLFASGNLDEDAFPDAATFTIDRAPNRHIAFSDGIHRCQGAAVGRIEMKVALDEILNAIPDYRIVTEGVRFRSVQGVHSVQSLPVTFTPSPAEALAASRT